MHALLDISIVSLYYPFSPYLLQAGSWGNVVEECRKAHFQPLLLVYSNPHGKPIDASKVR